MRITALDIPDQFLGKARKVISGPASLPAL